MSTALVKADRGTVSRQDFAGDEIQRSAETALAAVTARERALVEAHYLMAERHPRVWADVRVRILDHCSRPRFAEVSRYARPVGKKKVNGEWVDEVARGFTVRFTETLAQEMGNVKPEATVTFEDDLIRIIRFSVTDLQRNIPRSREVAIAKTVEKRGKKNRDNSWSPPEGREVLSERLNSYGEPTYLVKATQDEIRAKVNSEESKTQRDFTLKLCPRDILEDCEDLIASTLEREDKADPKAAAKRWVDGFNRMGVMPSDLMTYIGKPMEAWTDKEVKELRELAAALKEGARFDDCMQAKFGRTGDEEESPQERDARNQRTRQEQADRIKAATAANVKAEAATEGKKITQEDIDAAVSARAATSDSDEDLDARNQALDAEIVARESGSQPTPAPKLAFGRKTNK